MRTWQVRDAKARFSEFLEACLEEGPQVVTKRGVEAAVLVPVEQWRRLQKATPSNAEAAVARQDAARGDRGAAAR